MVRIYPRKEAYTTRVELLSLQASMVRSSIKRRTVRVLQLNNSAASGIDKSSFFTGKLFYNFQAKFTVEIFMYSDDRFFECRKFEADHRLPV